jgi:hypothetical protein
MIHGYSLEILLTDLHRIQHFYYQVESSLPHQRHHHHQWQHLFHNNSKMECWTPG